MSFRRTLAATVATVVMGSLFAAAPAQAAESWVTRAEYRAVKVGMTKARVHRIFDFRGILVIPAGGGHPYESRHYRMKVNGERRCIAVDYEVRNGRSRVVAKSRPWTPPPGFGCR